MASRWHALLTHSAIKDEHDDIAVSQHAELHSAAQQAILAAAEHSLQQAGSRALDLLQYGNSCSNSGEQRQGKCCALHQVACAACQHCWRSGQRTSRSLLLAIRSIFTPRPSTARMLGGWARDGGQTTAAPAPTPEAAGTTASQRVHRAIGTLPVAAGQPIHVCKASEGPQQPLLTTRMCASRFDGASGRLSSPN